MDSGDAVDGVGSDDGEMRHVHALLSTFFYARHSTETVVVSGKLGADKLKGGGGKSETIRGGGKEGRKEGRRKGRREGRREEWGV